MTYLRPEFQHDVFFSYAHADVDKDGSSLLKEWSLKLAAETRRFLLGRNKFADLSFYVDESKREDERLDETNSAYMGLKNAASHSALFLCVVSDWYLKSEWCRREREWWAGKSESCAPLVGPPHRRAFVCYAEEVAPEAAWPMELADERGKRPLGFTGYDRGKPEYERAPLGAIGDPDDLAAFKKLAVKIAGKLAKRLSDIDESLQEERARAEQAAKLAGLSDKPITVFIHAPEDCRPAYEKARDNLAEVGFVVMPEDYRPLPSSGRLTGRDADELIMCDGLFIATADATNSIGADLVNVGRNVRHLIKARAHKLLPCGVLDAVGRNAHPRQRIRNAENLGIKWFEMTHPAWTDDVSAWLRGSSELL